MNNPNLNPYAAPSAAVDDIAIEVPADVAKKIKSAWIAACVSGGFTLLFSGLAVAGMPMMGMDAWSFADAAVILGLAFGIYRKSRACAVLMLLYFIAGKIIMMVETGKPSGLLLSLVFAYYFWQGIVGTFAFHKLKTQARNDG